MNVQQDGLQSFLQTAELLGVHGLNTENRDKSDLNSIGSNRISNSVGDINNASGGDNSMSSLFNQNSASASKTTALSSGAQQFQQRMQFQPDDTSTTDIISTPGCSKASTSKKRKLTNDNDNDDVMVNLPETLGEGKSKSLFKLLG